MLLNITTTHQPATDLGYLLHKHPDKLQSVDLSVGKAHIFYPECTPEKTTVSLLLEINSVEMVRGNNNNDFVLAEYVNDRPYVASSLLSVALAKAFSSALNGKCKDKPELVTEKLPFEVTIAVLPAPQGGEKLIRKLFEPLGYEVNLTRHALDTQFPQWGESKYYTLHLKHLITTKELLSHLYVLIPALDKDKHYFVNESEIEKLLQKGEAWLKEHPEKEQIIRRYLKELPSLTRQALRRLNENEEEKENSNNAEDTPTLVQERKESLHEKRLKLVAEVIKASGATKVLDLGCGEGKLIKLLLANRQITEIVGMDVSYNELLKVKDKLHWERMSPQQQARLKLLHGSLTYKDDRLEGFEAAAVVEVIEHLELNRLQAFEKALFGYAKPKMVVLTTPNQEFNVYWEQLEAGTMRHDDHRFEWTRQEFATWTQHIATTYGYQAEILPVGEEVENIGSPSQMAIFTYEN